MVILIVEDDADSRTMLQTYLEHMGHTVMTAFNVRAARRMLIYEKIDLMLLDISLEAPHDGLELLRYRPKSTHVFITSASDPVEARRQAQVNLLEDVRWWLPKPLDLEMLSICLEKLEPARDTLEPPESPEKPEK